jgi:hypothetical protein
LASDYNDGPPVRSKYFGAMGVKQKTRNMKPSYNIQDNDESEDDDFSDYLESQTVVKEKKSRRDSIKTMSEILDHILGPGPLGESVEQAVEQEKRCLQCRKSRRKCMVYKSDLICEACKRSRLTRPCTWDYEPQAPGRFTATPGSCVPCRTKWRRCDANSPCNQYLQRGIDFYQSRTPNTVLSSIDTSDSDGDLIKDKQPKGSGKTASGKEYTHLQAHVPIHN